MIPQTQTNRQENSPAIEMHEAPYSWNVKVIGEEGYEEQFTVRAVTTAGFIARIDELKKHLEKDGYKPVTARSAPSATAPTAATEAVKCPECGGECWDNRNNPNRNPRAPLIKCKQCNYRKWPTGKRS